MTRQFTCEAGHSWYSTEPRQCPTCHPRSTLDVGAPFDLKNEWHTWHGRIQSIDWVTGEVTVIVDAIRPDPENRKTT